MEGGEGDFPDPEDRHQSQELRLVHGPGGGHVGKVKPLFSWSSLPANNS